MRTQMAMFAVLVGAASATGCTTILGIDKDYIEVLEGAGGTAGSGLSSSSSSSSASSTGMGGAGGSSSAGGMGGTGGSGGSGAGGTGGGGGCIGGAVEACNGIDDDCNGQVDDGLGSTSCGVGECQVTVDNCANGQLTTCMPKSPTLEICDGKDNNCNGTADEGNPGSGGTCMTGNAGVCSVGMYQCQMGSLVCVQNLLPSAESCDNLDNDCDGQTDEGVKTTFFKDADGDGFGDPNQSIQACTAPGYVTNNQDCNDSSFAIKPGGTEVCNGVDEDCDMLVDEGNPGGGAACTTTGNVGVCEAGTVTCINGALACVQNIQPSAEVCASALDENCDGIENCTGGFIWHRAYGSFYNDGGYGVTTDAAANVLVTGGFEGTVDFGGGALTGFGGADVFAVKLDASGNHIWSKHYGDGNKQLAKAIATDGSGNIILAGVNLGSVDFGGGPLTSPGGESLFVAKLSPTGTHIWSKQFSVANNYSFAADIELHLDGMGNVYAAGTFNGGTVDFGGGALGSNGLTGFVVKLDALGNHVLSKGFPIMYGPFTIGLAVNTSGQFALVGGFFGTINLGCGSLSIQGGSRSDMYVAKYSATGICTWNKRFGDTEQDEITAARMDTAGNIVFSGSVRGDVDFGGGVLPGNNITDNVVFVKLSSGGSQVWAKRYGQSTNVKSGPLFVDGAGNVLGTAFAGQNAIDFGGGLVPGEQYILKFDAAGNHVWSKGFGSAYFSSMLVADALGNVLMSGAHSGNNVEFGGGALPFMGGTDAFVVKFAP